MEDLVGLVGAGSPDAVEDVLVGLSDDELEDVTVRLQTLARCVDAVMLHAVAVMDRRQVPDRRYALSMRQWLGRFCRQTSVEAGRTVSTARVLGSMPNVAKRAVAGEVPSAGVRLLAQTRRRYGCEFRLHEETFADAGSSLDVKDLRRVVEYWRQQVDHAGVLDDIGACRARRRVSVSHTVDGMWHLEGLLDPVSGHAVATALRAHADPGNLDPTDHRTYSQRCADALTDICRFCLDHDDTVAVSGGERPHITVVVDYDQLTGASTRLPEIDGSPVDVETIRRLACDSRIVRIVTDGEGQPLDVGRTVRTVTPAIRRALVHRDGAVCGRAVTCPHRGATPTTRPTGPMADQPASHPPNSSADATTLPHTKAATSPPEPEPHPGSCDASL